MIKIAFTDIDGTLLDKDRRVSTATKKAVGQLTERGIPFILISSRMPRAMTHLQDDLDISGLPLIAYNGGLVIVDGKTVLSQVIGLDIVKAVIAATERTGLTTMLYYADEWYVPANEHYARRETNNTRTEPTVRPLREVLADWAHHGLGAHKIMVMGEPAELDVLITNLNSNYPGQLHLYRSKDDYLEIADARISKLTGVATLLQAHYPDLSLGDCIAFGDNYNDIDMLAGVGIGVAVGNARPEVKAVADFVVSGNKEDGVAEGVFSLVVR